MYQDLNQKQVSILLYIKEELQKRGYPPSVREIASALNIKSTSTVHSHLNKIEEKGYIKKDPTKPRAIEVISNSDDDLMFNPNTISIPYIGEVTAGEPILAIENIQDFIPQPTKWYKETPHFILKVKGDSMIDAGIFDGDLIVVEQTSSASNGDIVVALINGEEATVKKFFRENNKVRLQPENKDYDPIFPSDVSILGIVKTLIRKY
ncbi:repressor LexA [Acetoanaerobium pronyense]|uniref:LexA repressor n=1 Tax=Acetoanaerobium pronyense TaxID=1482736 RepID=A0ABS4KII7_9FIRM|nr:transcriptional repressor LexA [Acetoanaerobium pronyense]MBP2027051.1 repressor LexA [Acetoanaerobium pronyense]